MKFLPITAIALLAAVTLLDTRAQTPPAAAESAQDVKYPYGRECFITLDPQAALTRPPEKAAGFEADYTVRGQLIYLSEEWCVLKEGTYENWIPRDKVLLIRVSK